MKLFLGMIFWSLNLFAQSYESFDEFLIEVNRLEQNEKLYAAKELTLSVWDKFSDKEFELIKELEYINKKMRLYHDNIALWEKGHEKGFFFFLSKQMAKYRPYLDYAEFDLLVKRDQELRKNKMEYSKTKYEVNLPDNYDDSKSYPIFMILHGGGSNIEKAKKRWRRVQPLNSDFIMVYVQSYRHYDSKTFGWKSSEKRCREDLIKIWNNLNNKYLINCSASIVAGISAGGTMALDLVLNNLIPINNSVVFCPAIPKEYNLKNKQMRIFILGGESDFNLEKQKKLSKILFEEKIKYIHKIIPEMGHEFPSDYTIVLSEALSFIET